MVTIYKTQDVELQLHPEVRSDVDAVDVDPSRVAEFDHPENQARLIQPDRWPALYAKLEALGIAGIVPNIYVAHPTNSDRDGWVFNFMMGDIVLNLEPPGIGAKQTYFKKEFVLRASDNKKRELMLWAIVHGAGHFIDSAYFPNLFLNPQKMSTEIERKAKQLAGQIAEDLLQRDVELRLFWDKDISGPAITSNDLREITPIVAITASGIDDAIQADFRGTTFKDAAMLVASIADERTKRISGVVLAFEKDGKVLRQFFGNQKSPKRT